MPTKKELETEIESLKERLYNANNDKRHAIDGQTQYLDKLKGARADAESANRVIRALSILVDNRIKSKYPEPVLRIEPGANRREPDLTDLPEEFHWLRDVINRITY